MPEKQVSIEIGGFCARIKTKDSAVFQTVLQQFGGFTSTRSPCFTIEFTGHLAPHDGKINLNDMRLIRDKGRFLIRAERSFCRHVPRQIMDVGSIDMRKKICLLSSTSKALISPTILSCFQLFLLNANGFILHASAVAKKNAALVFAGPSGSGKSTVAKRSSGGRVLADDLVFIRKHGPDFHVYGTPWHSRRRQRPAKIQGIFFLRHAGMTGFEELTPGSAMRQLMANISMNVDDRIIQERLLRTLSRLAATRFCRLMRFSLRDSFWQIIEEHYPEKRR